MARALSVDLRDRVVAAIAGRSIAQAGSGSLRCERGKRDPVAAACDTARDAKASAAGGDRRSNKIEAHADLILCAYEATPDITLAELQALLTDHGTQVALGTIWRFFARRGITRKKRRRMRPSRTVPIS